MCRSRDPGFDRSGTDLPTYTYSVGEEYDGQRLDIFLRDRDEPDESRSQVKKRIDRGVVEKPAGMVVHPGPGHPDGTLVNALLYHLDDLAGIGGELRPGIVHRTDKETSGALVVSKTDEAHQKLAAQFKEHTIERVYHTLVYGAGLDDEGTFDTFHGRDPSNRMRYSGKVDKGRRAVTHWKVRERYDSEACLVECRLETGRTHQIRMHFYEANAPVLGDSMYAGRATSEVRIIDRQALHARRLVLTHPASGERLDFTSDYPEDFQKALDALRAGKGWRRG